MNTYTWQFPTIEVFPEVDGVTNAAYNAHWTLTADDGDGHTASCYGTQRLGPIDPASFTPFEDLTLSQVQGWVETEMGAERVAELKSKLDDQITREINPPSLSLAPPWTGVPGGGMIGRLIAILFLSRELAHREHLRTTSYAQHVALNEFYEAIVERADAIAEAYQGRHGIIDDIPMMATEFKGSIDQILEKQLETIEKIRYTAVDKSDTAIQNLIDEAVGQYLSTLYKLRNLK